MNLLLSITFIAIINIIITNYIYNLNDKNYYRCSKITQVIGFLLPIAVITYVLFLFNSDIIKYSNNLITHFSIFIVGISISMMCFHYKYQLDKKQN